jgi:phosphoglycerol transferase MdoB-like AlkP superfamily enzyme
MNSGWSRALKPFLPDLRLWALVMLLLSAFRATFIAIFSARLGVESGLGDIFQVLFYGMRFDCQVAGYVVALPVVVSLLAGRLPLQRLAAWLRVGIGTVFVFLALWMFVVAGNFFAEFDSQFNHFIFIGMEDDTSAIVQTVWKEYHPIPSTILVVLLFLPLWRYVRSLGRGQQPLVNPASTRPPLAPNVVVHLLVLVLLVLSIRGSVGKRPAQRIDAAISTDVFLNKCVMNPFVALTYAFKDHNRLNSTAGLGVFLPDRDLDGALARLFPHAQPSDNLDDYFLTQAHGPHGAPPRHVFVLLMESYDSWPMLPQYQSLQMTEGLKGLAAEGLQVHSFLSSSPGTMASVAGVLTGLPDAGLQTDLQPQTRFTYPTAVASIFRRLGYRTRFFYGGKLGWRNLDQFAAAQGFDEIYGSSHMGSWQHANEWGVDDEYLFDFIAETLSDDQPTFNFILSTSYHPPYDIDVQAKGYPVSEIPSDLAAEYDGSIDLPMWGHLWYADREMTAFVRAAYEKLPHAVFAVTGDHYARKFLNGKPSAFERSSVPFVLFGPEVLANSSVPTNASGSHIDIGPTLVELAAPAGFEYHALGRDLLNAKQVRPGFGRGFVIGPDYIAQLNPEFVLEAVPGKALPDVLPLAQDLRQLYNDAHAIAWWRVRNGAQKKESSQ